MVHDTDFVSGLSLINIQTNTIIFNEKIYKCALVKLAKINSYTLHLFLIHRLYFIQCQTYFDKIEGVESKYQIINSSNQANRHFKRLT